jgi:streptogramin lyase
MTPPARLRAALVCAATLATFALGTPRAWPSNGEPSIVEFGSTFRSAISGIAIGRGDAIWIGEADGIARLARSGTVAQVRRADDCDYCGTGDLAIGAGGRIWENGFDRVLRFAGSGLKAYDVVHQDCGWSGVRGFAATASALYTSRWDEPGLRRFGAGGKETRLLQDLGAIEALAAGPDGGLWLGISHNAQCGNAPIVELARYSTAGALRFVTVAGLSKYVLFRHFAVSPDGSLVVDAGTTASSGDARTTTFLLRISPGGTITELAQLPQPLTLSAIGGIAAASDGSIWFTQPAANRIGRVGTDGRVTEFREGIPSGASPEAIAVDRDGSVWFTDDGLNTVEHVAAGGHVRVYGNGLSPINTPGGPVVTKDGAIWFRETLSWHPRIARIGRDGKLVEFTDYADSPGSLQADGDGVIVLNITSSVRPALPTSAVRLSAAGTVTPFDMSGCLVTAMNLACLPALRGRGPITDSRASPNWVVRARDGNLWFTDSDNSQIGRVDGLGHFTFFTHGLTRFNSGPQYITVGPDGALWFTEIRDRVGRITLDGRIREFSRGIPFRSFPGGIVAGRDGNLWFTLYHGNELARITPGGVVTRFHRGIYPSRGSDSAVVDSIPFVDATGKIWFNEPQGGRIAVATLPR